MPKSSAEIHNNKIPKSSAELSQKAAGYMLAAANAAKRELKQINVTTSNKKSTTPGSTKKDKGKK